MWGWRIFGEDGGMEVASGNGSGIVKGKEIWIWTWRWSWMAVRLVLVLPLMLRVRDLDVKVGEKFLGKEGQSLWRGDGRRKSLTHLGS
jgi:hypothetical protein